MRYRLINARRVVAIGAALSALASVFGVVAADHAVAVVAPQRIAIPTYFWPGPNWDAVIGRSGAVGLAVLNVDSGPGAAAVNSFVTTVDAAKASGIRVVGYVHSTYGTRPLVDVLADIDRYYGWYDVDGVFVDELPNDCAQSAYYSAIASHVRSRPSATVVTNPGMNPAECAVSFSDIIVNFEGNAATYQSWSPAPWTDGYPADRFWHLVYGAVSTDVSSIVSLSRARNAGHVYVTDDTLANPWDTIPSTSTWSELLAAIAGRAAAPGAAGGPGSPPRAAAPVASSPAPTSVAPTTTSPAALASPPSDGPTTTTPAPPTTVTPTTVTPTTVTPTTVTPTTSSPTTSSPTTLVPAPLPGPMPTTTLAAVTAAAPAVESPAAPRADLSGLVSAATVPAPTDAPAGTTPPAEAPVSSAPPKTPASPVQRVATRNEPVRMAMAAPALPGRIGRTSVVARLLTATPAPRPLAVTARRARPAPCQGPSVLGVACVAIAVSTR